MSIKRNNAAWLNASQAQEVEALGLGDHVVSDMHVGAGGGVVSLGSCESSRATASTSQI